MYLAVSFLLGWRVMPRVWPGIKMNVVYRILPWLEPEPAETAEPEPYIPESNTAFGDPVSETDSLIYYFYKDYCPYCRQLEPLTAGLPEKITLPDGRTESAVRFVCLNKVEEEASRVIAEYYDAHDVPEERQYVPAVVIGERYLFLGVEIIDELMDALMAGEGLQTPLLNGQERVSDPL